MEMCRKKQHIRKGVMIMVNTELLKTKIKESGFKMKFLADKLNLSEYGFALKVSGKNEFKLSEMKYLSEILNISNEDRNLIFFNE